MPKRKKNQKVSEDWYRAAFSLVIIGTAITTVGAIATLIEVAFNFGLAVATTTLGVMTLFFSFVAIVFIRYLERRPDEK